MILKLLITLHLCLGVTALTAQSKIKTFLGIQPAVTIEPFYDKGELDVNVLPVVVEWSLCDRVNFRLLPTLNYHFGGNEQGISDVGFYSVTPFFFKKHEDSKYPYGFYLGPVLGIGRNLINQHYTLTCAVEPGYFFETKKTFSIALGIQLGRSFFAYDSQPNEWVLHWGPKVSFGFWFGEPKKE